MLNFLRRHNLTVNQPANGTNGGAVTVSGTIRPVGSAVEYAWGSDPVTPPSSGWTAATSAATSRSASTTYPAAGTRYLHARSKSFPASRVVSAAVTVA